MCVNHLLITNILFLRGHKSKVFLQLILQVNSTMKVYSLRHRHDKLNVNSIYLYVQQNFYIVHSEECGQPHKSDSHIYQNKGAEP